MMAQKDIGECGPTSFKPLLYRRYVDDTFVMFERKEHATLFFNYLNSRHSNLRFTMETENENKIPFLDLLITKNNTALDISIYRKPTFTGLGTNFLSSCYKKYKSSIIYTLLHRAFSLTSNYMYFDKEISFLKNFFMNNGFPESIFHTAVRKFLNTKFHNQPTKYGPQKLTMYIKMPFISSYANDILNTELRKLFLKHLPQIDIRLAIFNNYKLKSFFRCKETLLK